MISFNRFLAGIDIEYLAESVYSHSDWTQEELDEAHSVLQGEKEYAGEGLCLFYTAGYTDAYLLGKIAEEFKGMSWTIVCTEPLSEDEQSEFAVALKIPGGLQHLDVWRSGLMERMRKESLLPPK